jgi:hypothetical protein
MREAIRRFCRLLSGICGEDLMKVLYFAVIFAFGVGSIFLTLHCFRTNSLVSETTYTMSPERISATKESGDIVVLALENYRQRTGKYPDSLLVLEEQTHFLLPRPTAGGKEWYYWSDGNTYSLEFGYREIFRSITWPGFAYDRQKKMWINMN